MAPTALLMLKAPVEGEVKTRLGREVGMTEAVRVYRRLVEHQLQQIPAEWRRVICFAPAGALETMRAWLGAESAYRPQASGDLGARLTHAMSQHFAENEGPLVLLGGDCPYLDSVTLRRVEAALSEAEAVLVPAVDGGYCVLGLREEDPCLFRDITWSTPVVLEQTRERLREARMTWCELPTLEDVDDMGSWARACETLPALNRR